MYTQESEDCLANFKRAAADAGVTPLQAWTIYARKHWDAVASHAKGIRPFDNEPIQGRVMDLQNYLYLYLALIEEEE